MNIDSPRPFSKKWMILSMVIYIAAEIFIGFFIGGIIVGKYVSIGLQFMMQGLCMLLAYFVGGFLVGVISPGVRIYEPAAGAFACVALTMILVIFVPLPFFHFSLTKLIVGGAIAFVIALTGAKMGERITGNKL
ncbi:MAG: hypothetical protein HQL32_13020 [Planctomycetes bacterium]|nr:hypothetical protein [Planctomycetota bacterium]